MASASTNVVSIMVTAGLSLHSVGWVQYCMPWIQQSSQLLCRDLSPWSHIVILTERAMCLCGM